MLVFAEVVEYPNNICYCKISGLNFLILSITSGQTYGVVDGIQLTDGETYFVTVRGVNMLDYPVTVRSSGVTIDLEPLLPGVVKDGDVIGIDLKYQVSITSLAANWDGFGADQDDGPLIIGVDKLSWFITTKISLNFRCQFIAISLAPAVTEGATEGAMESASVRSFTFSFA